MSEIFDEINMAEKVDGPIVFVADVYKRSALLDGYSPWAFKYRIAVNYDHAAWVWYHEDDEGWVIDEEGCDFLEAMSDLLGNGTSEYVKAEIYRYKKK